MNEPPTSPDNATPDDPVEARIVAWVLGEASAFEAAEIERLCAEKPELLVFRRRMRELHGLLTEAEAEQPDETWKLPAEKRQAIEELFGREEAVSAEVAREKRINHTGRRAFLAIAACVTVTFFVVRLLPTGYEAEALLEIRPRSADIYSFSNKPTGSGASVTPQFFGTEFEKIKSHNSLGKVVDQLGLTTRWGMDRNSAISRLRKNTLTKNVSGTNLVSIRVREKTDEDAREITRAVAESYRDYRIETESREMDKALYELNKAVRDQEDKVEERRKVLATVVRTKGIIYKPGDEDQQARDVSQTQEGLRRDKMILESQINSLLKYDKDELMVYAAGLDLPNNVIREKYPQYLEQVRQLESMKAKGAEAGQQAI
ncbi:MAG: hypothetical protein EOP85_16885, partial [Verrucomicrobiaceae bacterium]